MAQICGHLRQLQTRRREATRPSGVGCQECLAAGDFWVHLRLCMSCGHVGCCDESPNRHASAHFRLTQHPVIKSFEPREDWAWCFIDEAVVMAIPTFPPESPSQHYSAPAVPP